MGPLLFMLAPRSTTTVEYDLWGPEIAFIEQATDELDYDDFSGTRLMPSLITVVCVLAFLLSLESIVICILVQW